MGLADLKRVTDLFVEGEEVVLRDGPDPVLLWVNKLNSFEQEEARRDGSAARSRLILALKEIGSPEYEQYESSLVELGDSKLKDEIVAAQSNDHFIEAVESIRNDPEWKERLEASQRRTPDMSPEERDLVMKIDLDYTEELQKRIGELRERAMRDLDGLDTGSLRERHQESWLDSRGLAAFSREFQKSQLYFALRTCKATSKIGVGAWDHSPCASHQQRALDTREEVVRLPSALLDRLLTVVRAVQVDRRDARFSDALASSSGSSAQPSEEVASTPSTPEEMSPELATTSS